MSKALEELERDLDQYNEEIEREDDFAYLESSMNILQGNALSKVVYEHKEMAKEIESLKIYQSEIEKENRLLYGRLNNIIALAQKEIQ